MISIMFCDLEKCISAPCGFYPPVFLLAVFKFTAASIKLQYKL